MSNTIENLPLLRFVQTQGAIVKPSRDPNSPLLNGSVSSITTPAIELLFERDLQTTSTAGLLTTSLFTVDGSTEKIHPPRTVSVENDIGPLAAKVFINQIKQKPGSVIVLPTGSTPSGMYKEIIKAFEKDRTLDFSKATFFNLDEYVGLSTDHPLGYNLYMNFVLYNKLREIDSTRAPQPENIFIPKATSTIDEAHAEATRYEAAYLEKTKANGGKADIVFLGMGGVYPREEDKSHIDGAHVGFNEANSVLSDIDNPSLEELILKDRTKVIELCEKTKKHTGYRFRNLKWLQERNLSEGNFATTIPTHAITLGVGNILQANKIILMANGEEKALGIKELLNNEAPRTSLTASFLKQHDNVHLILDPDAASQTSYVQSPWQVNNIDYEKEDAIPQLARQVIISILEKDKSLTVNDISASHLDELGLNDEIKPDLAKYIETLKTHTRNSLKNSVHSSSNPLLPKAGETVVIFSPHPDDDVICASATIKEMIASGVNVHVIYTTSGINAVREDFARSANGRRINEKITPEQMEQLQFATRKDEAIDALSILGMKGDQLTSNLHFLNLPLYRTRGFIHTPSYSYDTDIKPVEDLLRDLQPQHIFYSAENDPHGAHGLTKKVMFDAIKSSKLNTDGLKLWGYRGAYNEWPLYEEPESLIINPYDDTTWEICKKSVMAHASQLNPLYPSFDSREFWERKNDRNSSTGSIINRLDLSEHSRAEAFKVTTLVLAT